MNWDYSQFHFIRPLCLFAIPAFVGLWLLMVNAQKTTYWEQHLNKKILEALRVASNKRSSLGRWMLLLGWIIACLAVAGPTWQKQAVPSFQNKSAMVIVLDLSVSMLAEDLSPNRFTQAKYKVIDILRARKDGQTALIVYSGDAHTVTPLTDDPNAIEALLPAVHPSIMPLKGSNTEAAIALAAQLLKDSGITGGQILLITDGVTESAQRTVLANIAVSLSISVLGVGQVEATPVPLQDGGFLRNSAGEIILSSLDNQQLSQFAAKAGGRYSQIRVDSADVNYLIDDQFSVDSNETDSTAMNSSAVYDNWTDMGHWLVLLLLPLAALCFRKGVIYLLPLCFIAPPDSNAFEWQDLWLTQDQQAQQLLRENPQAAAEKFKRQDWSGVANYQAQEYATAAEKFADQADLRSHYNRGNALAMAGDLEGAIGSYEKAIELDPNYADATYNKKVVEKLLEQQEQQNQEGDDQDSDSEQEPSADDEPSDDQEPSEDGEPSEDEEQESDDQQDSEGKPDAEEEEPSADEETSEDEEPLANEEEPSAEEEEPSANEEEPSAEEEEPSANEEEPSIAEATPDQLQDSSEQWLRAIQEDPSGLLRRKFEYQAWQRANEQSNSQTKTTNSSDERY